jgi:hypothetical protein
MKIGSIISKVMNIPLKRVSQRYRRNENKLRNLRDSLTSEEANAFIANKLKSGKPFMVARFGSVELEAIKQFRKMERSSIFTRCIRNLLSGYVSFSAWPEEVLAPLENNAGFFPADAHHAQRFSTLMIESMSSVDLLGSWVAGEGYFEDEFESATICPMMALEPYYHQTPWSQHLKGKHVVVIHPFSTSIKKQFEQHRQALFANPLVLPDFTLTTITAVQSIAGNRPPEYDTWFDALEAMKDAALATDGDVFILGCGAYGFPLAAALKNVGKQVIHLGGSTQILFGIKGRRWNDNPIISGFYNEQWIVPSEDERPKGIEKVENACYW